MGLILSIYEEYFHCQKNLNFILKFKELLRHF